MAFLDKPNSINKYGRKLYQGTRLKPKVSIPDASTILEIMKCHESSGAESRARPSRTTRNCYSIVTQWQLNHAKRPFSWRGFLRSLDLLSDLVDCINHGLVVALCAGQLWMKLRHDELKCDRTAREEQECSWQSLRICDTAETAGVNSFLGEI
jgi:hypothetical protein